MGVRSKSRHKPIKQGNFPLAVRHFEGKPTHYDWVFQYPNPSMAAVAGLAVMPSMVPAQSATFNYQSGPAEPSLSGQSMVSEDLNASDDAMNMTDTPSVGSTNHAITPSAVSPSPGSPP